MWLQQQLSLKKIALGVAMSFAAAGSGFAQQQAPAVPASSQAVGPVSATVIGVAAIAVGIAIVTANDKTTSTAGTK